MFGLTKSAIEGFAIRVYARLGYDYITATDGDNKRTELTNSEARVAI